MSNSLFNDAKAIYETAIFENMPNEAVKKALDGFSTSGKIVLVSIGKAGWEMAKPHMRFWEARLTQAWL